MDVSQEITKNSIHDQDDDFESNDPAHLLQERIERSKKSKKGACGRRATIAFADELQATLADHLKTFDTTEDKPTNNALLSPVINTSDEKPILKQHGDGIQVYDRYMMMTKVSCECHVVNIIRTIDF